MMYDVVKQKLKAPYNRNKELIQTNYSYGIVTSILIQQVCRPPIIARIAVVVVAVGNLNKF
jgi:hypothetical protein